MANSTLIMWLLIGFYALITVLAATERNYPRVLYFLAAILISLAVMWMDVFERRL